MARPIIKVHRRLPVLVRQYLYKLHCDTMISIPNCSFNKVFQRKAKYAPVRLIAHYTVQVPIPVKKEHHKENPQRWVRSQRANHKREMVPTHRVDHLKSIGFIWKINHQVPWFEMFQKLVLYKNEHKSTFIPQRYKEDQKLADWAHNQRRRYSKERLSVEQIEYLESIEFVWDIRVPWSEMYERLVAFNKCNHSTLVPKGINITRASYLKNELTY